MMINACYYNDGKWIYVIRMMEWWYNNNYTYCIFVVGSNYSTVTTIMCYVIVTELVAIVVSCRALRVEWYSNMKKI